MTEQTQDVTETVGWRVFEVREDGALVPPWAGDHLTVEPWSIGRTYARCPVSRHAAPDPDCTCGLRVVVDLPTLIECAQARTFEETATSLLGSAGCLVRVRGVGDTLPGVDIPEDDPESTVRLGGAEILDVHLSAEMHTDATAERVSRFYNVPVVTYAAAEWPDAVAPYDPDSAEYVPAEDVEGFLWRVRNIDGFGTKDPSPEEFLPMARDGAAIMRETHCGQADVIRAWFDSEAEPSFYQASALLECTITCLAPDLAAFPKAPVMTEGFTREEIRARDELLKRRGFPSQTVVS